MEYIFLNKRKLALVSAFISTVIVTGLLVVVFFKAYGAEADMVQRMTCRMFKSQEEAQDAYRNGSRYLDGDKDGKACESFFR